MSKRLEGKTCVITGAGHGIGLAIARRLADDGAQVVIGDIDEDAASEAVGEITKGGGTAAQLRCDVTRRKDITGLIQFAVEKYGRLDVMFNNAGMARAVPFLDTTEETWDELQRLNVMGVLMGTQEAARQFLTQGGGGKIINTASVASKQGFALVAAYSATKFAVVALTQAAARELAGDKITVNGFCPGIVATDLWTKLDAQIMATGRTSKAGQAMAEFGEDILLGRLSTPEDCAGIGSFLASSDSDYITGQSLMVEGGMVLQ